VRSILVVADSGPMSLLVHSSAHICNSSLILQESRLLGTLILTSIVTMEKQPFKSSNAWQSGTPVSHIWMVDGYVCTRSISMPVRGVTEVCYCTRYAITADSLLSRCPKSTIVFSSSSSWLDVGAICTE
jgi:hypothetical protein